MERILHFLKEKFVNADSLANATRFIIKDLFTKEERELQERTFSVSGLESCESKTYRVSVIA